MDKIYKQNLSEQTRFQLDQIIDIENYFHQEIDQKKLCCKKLGKFATALDYIDKVFIVLSATSGRVCIILSASVVGAPIGIAGASFTLILSLATGITKKLLSTIRNKKKKHDRILMMAKSKLDSIKSLISQALNDMEISHEEFVTILKEKGEYVKMKVLRVLWKMKKKKLLDWIICTSMYRICISHIFLYGWNFTQLMILTG